MGIISGLSDWTHHNGINTKKFMRYSLSIKLSLWERWRVRLCTGWGWEVIKVGMPNRQSEVAVWSMEPYVTVININLAGIRIRMGGKTMGEPPLLRERVSGRERTRGLGSSKEPGRESTWVLLRQTIGKAGSPLLFKLSSLLRPRENFSFANIIGISIDWKLNWPNNINIYHHFLKLLWIVADTNFYLTIPKTSNKLKKKINNS